MKRNSNLNVSLKLAYGQASMTVEVNKNDVYDGYTALPDTYSYDLLESDNYKEQNPKRLFDMKGRNK